MSEAAIIIGNMTKDVNISGDITKSIVVNGDMFKKKNS